MAVFLILIALLKCFQTVFQKVYALYIACFFFTAIGGATSLQNDEQDVVEESVYESLRHSAQDNGDSNRAHYYPPDSVMMNSATSFLSSSGGNGRKDVEDA